MANPDKPVKETSTQAQEQLQAAGSQAAAQAAAVFDGSGPGGPEGPGDPSGNGPGAVPAKNTNPFRTREDVINYLERHKASPLMIGRISREVFDMLIYEGFSEEEVAAAFDRAKEVSARDLTVSQIRQEVRYQLVYKRLAALLPPDYEKKHGGNFIRKTGNAMGYAPMHFDNGTDYTVSLQLDFKPWLRQWGDWDMIRDGVWWAMDILPQFQEHFSLHRELLYHSDRLYGLIAKDQVFADLLADSLALPNYLNLLGYARGELFHMSNGVFAGKDVVFSPSDILIASRTMWRHDPWRVDYRGSATQTMKTSIRAAVILEMTRRLGQAPDQHQVDQLVAVIQKYSEAAGGDAVPGVHRWHLHEFFTILAEKFPQFKDRVPPRPGSSL